MIKKKQQTYEELLIKTFLADEIRSFKRTIEELEEILNEHIQYLFSFWQYLLEQNCTPSKKDAEVISSLKKYYQRKGFLTEKQRRLLSQLVYRLYSGKSFRIADGKFQTVRIIYSEQVEEEEKEKKEKDIRNMEF